MCAVLKILHPIKHILNEEECRRVGKAGRWWDDELAVAIAVKPPSMVKETLDLLEKEFWGDMTLYGNAAKQIKSKLCST